MTPSSAPISGIALPSRYSLLFKLASGGTASVYLGCIRGFAGFWRLVAVKVAHTALYHGMMVEEAALASKLHHPNVVPVIDVEDASGKLLLVMDYVEGATISELGLGDGPQSARVAIRIALDACAGLHAAHSLTDADGRSLNLVHRDVSPQNILVGTDGVARLTDFGIAKTTVHRARSAVGVIKGKLAYMAPEYVKGQPANAASDVFGLAVVVWEMLAGRRLFRGRDGHETLTNVLQNGAPFLSSVAPQLGPHLDEVLATALSKAPEKRHRTAREFGAALEAAAARADLIGTAEEVSAFVIGRVGAQLAERRRRIGAVMAAEQTCEDVPDLLTPMQREEVTRRDRVISIEPPALEESAHAGPPSSGEPPIRFSQPEPDPLSFDVPAQPRRVVHLGDDEPTSPSRGAPPPPNKLAPETVVHGQTAARPKDDTASQVGTAGKDDPDAGGERDGATAPNKPARVRPRITIRALAMLLAFACGGAAELILDRHTSRAEASPPGSTLMKKGLLEVLGGE